MIQGTSNTDLSEAEALDESLALIQRISLDTFGELLHENSEEYQRLESRLKQLIQAFTPTAQ